MESLRNMETDVSAQCWEFKNKNTLRCENMNFSPLNMSHTGATAQKYCWICSEVPLRTAQEDCTHSDVLSSRRKRSGLM